MYWQTTSIWAVRWLDSYILGPALPQGGLSVVSLNGECKAVSELVATAMAMTAKGVAKAVLYFSTCWMW